MAESLSTPEHAVAAPVSRHQLLAEHSWLDSELQKLHQKRFLSAEEELLATRLKKRKLHLKDAMRQLQP